MSSLTYEEILSMLDKELSKMSKSDIKKFIISYNTIDKSLISKAIDKFNIDNDDTLLNKSLISFYIKGKPPVRLPLRFKEYSDVVKTIRDR